MWVLVNDIRNSLLVFNLKVEVFAKQILIFILFWKNIMMKINLYENNKDTNVKCNFLISRGVFFKFEKQLHIFFLRL